MDMSTVSEGVVKHPKYYFDDGSCVVQCGSFIYKIHRSLMVKKSAFFAGMFSLPPESDPVDGATDAKPLIIERDEKAFEYLITFLYDGNEIREPTLGYLLALLDFAQYLDIITARRYALHMLPLHPDFIASPAVQFACARQYRVVEWVAPSFLRLMRLPLDSITLTEAMDIGMEWYIILQQTKAEIDMFRRNTAYSAPPHVASFLCPNPGDQCRMAWELGWWICYGKHLLHPDVPKSCEDAMVEMSSAYTIRDMCMHCKTKTLESVEDTNMFGEVDALVGDAILKLRGLAHM